jgi:hypothetical protein
MPQPRTPAKTKKATKLAKAAEAEAANQKAEVVLEAENMCLLRICFEFNKCDMF